MSDSRFWMVKLQGEGFRLRVGSLVPSLQSRLFRRREQEVKTVSFFTTRYVVAPDPSAAENEAVRLVREDPSLLAASEGLDNSGARIYLEEIAELESFEGLEPPGQGYTFFAED